MDAGKGQGHLDHGPSSAWMHDPSEVLSQIPLLPGHVFLDLGCGAGDYTLAASHMVGDQGAVYAFDIWDYLINRLNEAVSSRALKNTTAQTVDITAGMPLADHSADVAFMATLLYLFTREQVDRFFPDLHRVFKPGGVLAIVEAKKEDRPFGPVKEVRVSPEELEKGIVPFGFRQKGYFDLGYNYMILFEKVELNH